MISEIIDDPAADVVARSVAAAEVSARATAEAEAKGAAPIPETQAKPKRRRSSPRKAIAIDEALEGAALPPALTPSSSPGPVSIARARPEPSRPPVVAPPLALEDPASPEGDAGPEAIAEPAVIGPVVAVRQPWPFAARLALTFAVAFLGAAGGHFAASFLVPASPQAAESTPAHEPSLAVGPGVARTDRGEEAHGPSPEGQHAHR